jgi:predicted lipoprotein
MKLFIRVATLAMAFGLLTSACGGGESDLGNAVGEIADGYLSPIYATSSGSITDLAALSVEACSDSAAPLDGARDAWKVAEADWMATEAGWFGPTTMDRADSDIGYQPTSESGIEETLASDHLIDPTFVRDSLPTTQKGLGAIEYILFSGTPLDDRRCEYLVAVADVVAEDAAALNGSWNVSWDGEDSFVDQFKGIGDMALTPRESLGLTTSGIVLLAKKLTLDQLGKALGITSPEPHPDAYPEGQADFGLAALRSQIKGISDSYGMAPESMSGAVASRDDKVDVAIQGALRDALAEVDSIIAVSGSTSFASALESHHAELEQLYDSLAILRRTFETDVVSLLDVNLGFSDSDGDSG